MDIVDAQLHLGLEPDADRLIATMEALGIASVVLDELWGRNANDHGIPCAEFADGAYRPLSLLAQAAALRHPGRFCFLQRVTRRDPQLRALVAVLATSPGCRSLRVVLGSRDERHQLAAGGYDELFTLAQDHGLPICLLSKDAGALLQGVIARFPGLQFVIDHCGWAQTDQQWRDVLQLADHPNACLKWCHATRAFGQDGDRLQHEFLRAIGAFGADRLLWASDLGHEETGESWDQLLSFVQDNSGLSTGDKEWVLGKTARRVFRWDVRVDVS